MVVFYLIQPPHLPRQWSLSWSAWRRGWGRRPPRQSCPRQWAPPPLGRWSKLHLRIKMLRRASHKLTPSYLSANPRREWTVQERSCCGESSFWWRAHTPGRSWGWRRRPWPHRAEMGSPWRTWPHLGWRRTQWSPLWRRVEQWGWSTPREWVQKVVLKKGGDFKTDVLKTEDDVKEVVLKKRMILKKLSSKKDEFKKVAL